MHSKTFSRLSSCLSVQLLQASRPPAAKACSALTHLSQVSRGQGGLAEGMSAQSTELSRGMLGPGCAAWPFSSSVSTQRLGAERSQKRPSSCFSCFCLGDHLASTFIYDTGQKAFCAQFLDRGPPSAQARYQGLSISPPQPALSIQLLLISPPLHPVN